MYTKINTTRHFSDLIDLIEKQRTAMLETNPFFKIIADETLSIEQRMQFVPYMLFFSCGAPDVITLLMKSNNDPATLNFIEKKIDAFINEDNFHYNFYLQDLETLGFTMEKFGSVNAVVRHVFSEESIPARRLVYCISHYSRQQLNPLIRLTLCELLEAGLYDLFVTIYKKMIKTQGSPFAHLHYFGDTHVNLEMNHTVTAWFSGQESDVTSIEIPPYLWPSLVETVMDIMSHFNEMYLAFHAVIIKGNSIYPEKYNIRNYPPIDQITNNASMSIIESKKCIVQQSLSAMQQHRVFKLIDSIEKLRIFMQWHVFAVWDFMSLVKRLQIELTGFSLPWLPPNNASLARLINEIVIGEETDQLPNGLYSSHFDLYREAMKEINASTEWIDRFINQLKEGIDVDEILAKQSLPEAIKNFVKATLLTACEGNIFDVLGSFFYGREDSIPEMFQSLLDNWSMDSKDAPLFVYYLQRHIQLDANSHAPALQTIMDELTKNDPQNSLRILDSAIMATEQRIKLWDALASVLDNETCHSGERK